MGEYDLVIAIKYSLNQILTKFICEVFLEKEITDNSTRNRRYTCLLISQRPDGLAVTYMPVSPQQKKALGTLARYFEANGGTRQPMSVAVRTVLTRARDIISATP